ncbi:MAG: hypothetical protein D4S01_09110 [Dehalococcoidia bacterium]|nr:MAG: hypothetical protein D4S01_09110 [Dehalococcoidia bacterium]
MEIKSESVFRIHLIFMEYIIETTVRKLKEKMVNLETSDVVMLFFGLARFTFVGVHTNFV